MERFHFWKFPSFCKPVNNQQESSCLAKFPLLVVMWLDVVSGVAGADHWVPQQQVSSSLESSTSSQEHLNFSMSSGKNQKTGPGRWKTPNAPHAAHPVPPHSVQTPSRSDLPPPPPPPPAPYPDGYDMYEPHSEMPLPPPPAAVNSATAQQAADRKKREEQQRWYEKEKARLEEERYAAAFLHLKKKFFYPPCPSQSSQFLLTFSKMYLILPHFPIDSNLSSIRQHFTTFQSILTVLARI